MCGSPSARSRLSPKLTSNQAGVVRCAFEASRSSQEAIAGRSASRTTHPSPRQERARERAHSSAREAVDDVNDVLLAPFAFAEPDTDDRWARRGVPTLVALLVYGVGLGFLARMARG